MTASDLYLEDDIGHEEDPKCSNDAKTPFKKGTAIMMVKMTQAHYGNETAGADSRSLRISAIEAEVEVPRQSVL